MFLVLAADTDPVAAAVAAHLPADTTVWLTPTEVVRATWVHRVDDTSAGFQCRTPAMSIDSGEVSAVLNRLQWLPPVPMAASRDRDYAAFEWHALLMSALHSLGPRVINPPHPPSLAGPRRSPVEALAVLRRRGLPALPTSCTTDGRAHTSSWPAHPWQPWLQPGEHRPPAATPSPVPVGRRPVVWAPPVHEARTCWLVDGEVFGTSLLDDAHHRDVADALGCPLVQFDVASTEEGPAIAGADTFPLDVPPSVAEAVARWMRGRS